MESSIGNLIINTKGIENNYDIGNKLSDFEILQILGKGAYGFVAKVKSKLNLRIYALKKYDSEYLTKPEAKKYVINESIFMKQLNNENVVRLYNNFKDKDDLYLVMEYMDGGDLYTFLEAHMNLNLRINEEKLWDIFGQCLRGLVYLHQKGLLHRDIKPANILMNSKGEVKYSDFNVSAIINSDKARDFIKEKNKEENLLNNMTVVGSGDYTAPEIKKIYVEYDLKIDVYSLGITFCTLAFFDMKIPDEETMISNGYSYSNELINGIIKRMINENASERPTSQQIYNTFIKYYVEKYVYNTGLYSCILSLFSSPSLNNYFRNNNFNKEQMSQNPIFAKLYEIFNEIYPSQQNSNNMNNNYNNNLNFDDGNEKKTINHLIYDLRELLIKKGLNAKEKGNNEIDPINIITFLLKKLHEELNIYKGKIGNSQHILLYSFNSGNPKSDAYKNYKNFYTNNFKSIISQEFYGLIKTKSSCKACKEVKYDFNVLCYIPFNVKILVDMMKVGDKLNLYYAFDCLNRNIIEFDKRQFVQCEKCKTATVHNVLKQFHNLSKNLVIIFDRGENYSYKNFIDFPEDFLLDWNYVENFKNINVNYKLNSIICRSEVTQNNNIRTQEIFKLYQRINGNGYNNKYFVMPNNGQSEKQIYDLNEIKKNELVMILFYYSDNGIPNFSEDSDIIQNQMSCMKINNFNNNGNMNNFNNMNNNFNGNNININNNNFNGNNNNNFGNNNFNGINMKFNNNNFNNINNNKNVINNNFQNNNGFNFQFNSNFNPQQNFNNNPNFININPNNSFNQMNDINSSNFNSINNNIINNRINMNNNPNGFISINNQNQQNSNFGMNNFIQNNFNNQNNNNQIFNNNQIIFNPFSNNNNLNNNNFNKDQTNINNFELNNKNNQFN